MSIYTPPPTSSANPEPQVPTQRSPKWGSNVKLIVGLSIVALIAALVIYFRNIIGPLLLAFVLTYLLHPVAAYISKITKLSWRASVNVIFIVLLILILGSSTATGVAVFQQVQHLIEVVTDVISNLDKIAADLSTRVFALGPFTIDLSKFDLTQVVQEVVNFAQPMLTRLTGLVSVFATGAASTIGWTLFVLVISYFILADASRVPGDLLYVEVPGYDYDIRRLIRELGRIWNAFLRGQLILLILVIISYTILMTILGVRYALGIAILAGLARFVPYVGPATTWTVTALVAFLQGSNYFGLEPWQFTLLVIVAAVVLDQIFDTIISPRLLGESLGVHPAAVLVAALVGANLLGVIGLVLAAPSLATLQLLGRYLVRKMLDLDPWPEAEKPERHLLAPPEALLKLRDWYKVKTQKRTLK